MNAMLINARKKKKKTITQAANEIGLSYGMLAMMETSRRSGSDATKIKVSKYYGMTVQELFYNN